MQVGGLSKPSVSIRGDNFNPSPYSQKWIDQFYNAQWDWELATALVQGDIASTLQLLESMTFIGTIESLGSDSPSALPVRVCDPPSLAVRFAYRKTCARDKPGVAAEQCRTHLKTLGADDIFGQTCLFFACKEGQQEIVRWLLETHDFPVDAKDGCFNGLWPIHWAIWDLYMWKPQRTRGAQGCGTMGVLLANKQKERSERKAEMSRTNYKKRVTVKTLAAFGGQSALEVKAQPGVSLRQHSGQAPPD
eukprot:g721.t1